MAAFLAGRTAELRVSNRSRASADDAATRLGATAIDLPLSLEILRATDLLVNCTTVGYQDGPQGSPVDPDDLSSLPKGAAVYDIIYQPRETPLLNTAAALGLATRDGLGMNMDQAVIAWIKANPDAL